MLVFLAELFFTFEVRPAKCVRVYGSRPEITSPEGNSIDTRKFIICFSTKVFSPYFILCLYKITAAGLVRRNGHYGLVSSATKRSFQQPVSPIPDLRNSYNSFPDTNRIR